MPETVALVDAAQRLLDPMLRDARRLNALLTALLGWAADTRRGLMIAVAILGHGLESAAVFVNSDDLQDASAAVIAAVMAGPDTTVARTADLDRRARGTVAQEATVALWVRGRAVAAGHRLSTMPDGASAHHGLAQGGLYERSWRSHLLSRLCHPRRFMTPSAPAMPQPKVFLSYCYTSSEFVKRVDKLANDLMGDGVQVVFDRWDLREGQDLHAFMEQAVNDPTVTHVLILCDPPYAQKADDRRGGVGTETLILSPGVYQDAGQSRVVPVIMERDEEDHVQVPTYLVGRRYIDLSSDERMAENYEQLIRHLYDRPAQPRPALGLPPAYLDEQYVPLKTASAERLARTALLGHRGDAPGRLADYLDRLAGVIASEDLTDPPGEEKALIAVVMASIERFRPYRDEFLTLLRVAARYAGARPELYERLHGFFERVASTRYRHEQKRWDEAAETENLGFIGWELMLEATAVLLQEGQHVGLARLLQPMYVRSRYNGGALRSVDVLEPGFRLIARGNELSGGTRWAEPAAQLLRARVEGTGLSFESIMEADLLLWYRSVTGAERTGYWYPRTLVYAESAPEFPLFARARSTAEFARLAPALGARDRAEFVRWFRGIEADDFFRIGRAVGGRAAYERLLGVRPDET